MFLLFLILRPTEPKVGDSNSSRRTKQVGRKFDFLFGEERILQPSRIAGDKIRTPPGAPNKSGGSSTCCLEYKE